MMDRIFRRAAAALVLLAAAVVPASAQEAAPAPAAETAAPAAAGTSPPTISVVAAAMRTVAESVSVTGSLVAREEVQVGADVDGLRIETLEADEGDTVEAGAVLARLSTDTIEVQLAQKDSELARADAAIAQTESQIAEARATLTEAESALARTRTLAERGVVAQDVLDQRVSAAATARARLASAEQGLAVSRADRTLIEAQRAELELRKTKAEIKAPTAGLVLERAARIGSIVSAQSGTLFRIARDGLVELDAEVIETELARVEPGQPVAVTVAGGHKVQGTVRLVSPEVNATTRLGHVRIAFPADTDLRVGSFVRGSIEVARREGVTVPVAAVVTSGDTSTVQVVVDGKIEERTVETGLSAGGFVEVTDGLKAGETVVARAGTFLRDGDAITPVADADEETKG